MDKQLQIGVIGCGYWGPNLIRNFSSAPGCTLKAVSDLDEQRLRHMRDLHPGIETTTDFEEILQGKDIDGVAIATPVRFHFDMAKASLLAGKHTYIEKPMASSTAQCQELVELASERNLTLMVGHTFIYSSPVREIKRIVDSGDLGTILYISSRRLNLGLYQQDINVAWDLAPHDLSIILYIMGEPPISVNCQGKAHVTRHIEDVTNMSLEFSKDRFAMIHSSWLDPNKVREMTIVGSKRMILYDDMQPLEKIKIYDKRVDAPPHYDSFGEFQYSYHYGDMYAPYIKQVEPLRALCEHFADCIRTGREPITSGLAGLRLVQILEAASTSLKEGGARVPTPPMMEPAVG